MDSKISFGDFVRLLWPVVEPQAPFVESEGLVVALKEVEAFANKNNEENYQILNMPPRTMKSLLCQVFLPAYLLLHNPNDKILVVHYYKLLNYEFLLKEVLHSSQYKQLSNNSSGQENAVCFLGCLGSLPVYDVNWMIMDDPSSDGMRVNTAFDSTVSDWIEHISTFLFDELKKPHVLLVATRNGRGDLTDIFSARHGLQCVNIPVTEFPERYTPEGLEEVKSCLAMVDLSFDTMYLGRV